jgi:tetratricopeptide (TPR) repeat protein
MQNDERIHTVKRVLIMIAAPLLVLGTTQLCAQQPQPPAGAPSPAPARRPPQARTQPEFKDYNSAYAVSGGAAMEKAASDFEEKYPSSELRSYLYAKAMHEYQTENNGAKMLAMGERVLKLDPDNTVALVLTATVLSDNLDDADQDRTAKISEIKKNAHRALDTVDASLPPVPGSTAEQMTAYKNTLRSMAHSAVAITDLKTGDNSNAEKEFRIAADLTQSQPDPYIWYHLALAQDHQGKYTEALASVTQALKYTGSNAELAKLAAGEQERLAALTAAPAGNAPPEPSPSRPPQ